MVHIIIDDYNLNRARDIIIEDCFKKYIGVKTTEEIAIILGISGRTLFRDLKRLGLSNLKEQKMINHLTKLGYKITKEV